MVDEKYMRRALALAEQGRGLVEPNPLVGAVLVANDEIIGEGYHAIFGGPHAEVNAIASVLDQKLLVDSTLYVTLEPCSHFGKTPPCSDLIIAQKIPRVVIGTLDPNPVVNGRGARKLKDAGVVVYTGILEGECKELNRRFFIAQLEKRTFVLLKWAESKDAFIDKLGQRTPISSPDLQVLIHQWRSECDAIMVGSTTVLNDDPELTVRAFRGKNPIRVILGGEELDVRNYKVFNDEAETIVLNRYRDERVGPVSFIKVAQLDPKSVLQYLYQIGIHSLMVEGGAKTLQFFLDAGLWDEARVIIGDCVLGKGTPAPKISDEPEKVLQLHGNEIRIYRKA